MTALVLPCLLHIRSFAFGFLAAVMACTAYACPEAKSKSDTVDTLSATALSMHIETEDGERTITTLGSLKNTSVDCFDQIHVEIKYFDASGALIDTVTDKLYSIVSIPQQEVPFRVQAKAARPASAYATQSIRIVSAQFGDGAPRQRVTNRSTLVEFVWAWVPTGLGLLFFLALMKWMTRKGSPHSRSMALMEKQAALVETQNKLLERLLGSEALLQKQADPS